jgi:hypothetical protein
LAGHAADGGESGAGGRQAEAGGTSGTPAATPPVCAAIGKLDLLFVVDNSNSMLREQESLKQQFPAIIRALTTGKRPTSGSRGFPSVKDIHVGVVSTDMGIPGVDFLSGNCRADGGDDGKLRHEPHGDGCDSSYPPFLSYVDDLQTGQTPEPAKLANDVGCVAMLGTGGCGFEQQLEAPFKALWPKVQTDAAGLVVPDNEYRFLATTEPGTWGKGDVPTTEGGNQGFLRNRPDQGGPSLIAVVLVTDEEDCSVKTTEHLKPNNQLAEDSPYRKEDINLRCYYHKEFLYDLKKRYYEGLRKLRPGLEDRVVFAAIAGVPTDLVGPDVLAKVDFTSNDASSRDAFYDAILNDSRMQETLDPTTNPGSGQGNLRPSCSRMVPGESQPSTAWPPRRIVELAKLFGKNGMVQSICQDDFTQVSAAVVETIARKLEHPCP